MLTPERIWRTLDGELVAEGHPDAARLAYGVDDEVENRDAVAVSALLKPATKQAKAAPNKQAAKPADK